MDQRKKGEVFKNSENQIKGGGFEKLRKPNKRGRF